MATYKVEYTTTEKPEGLPPNASVEKLSALPAKVGTPGGTVRVRRRSAFLGKATAAELAFEAVPRATDRGPRTVGLDESACRELATALIAAADEFKAERAQAKADAERVRRSTAEQRLNYALDGGTVLRFR